MGSSDDVWMLKSNQIFVKYTNKMLLSVSSAE